VVIDIARARIPLRSAILKEAILQMIVRWVGVRRHCHPGKSMCSHRHVNLRFNLFPVITIRRNKAKKYERPVCWHFRGELFLVPRTLPIIKTCRIGKSIDRRSKPRTSLADNIGLAPDGIRR